MYQAPYMPELIQYSHKLYGRGYYYPHYTDDKTDPERELGSVRKQCGQDSNLNLSNLNCYSLTIALY